MADPSKSKAGQMSFSVTRPEDASITEALAALSRLADRAMVAGADPSAPVAPDHALLMICDQCILAKRQHDQLEQAWRAMTYDNPEKGRAEDEWLRATRVVKGLVMKARKFSAQTPAGLFGKAALVSRTGSAAAIVALTLADDLLSSPELRKAVWPAADQRGSNSS
jgi:hypothetical protein